MPIQQIFSCSPTLYCVTSIRSSPGNPYRLEPKPIMKKTSKLPSSSKSFSEFYYSFYINDISSVLLSILSLLKSHNVLSEGEIC